MSHSGVLGLSGHALRSFTRGGLAIVMFVINNVCCCLRYQTDSIDCQFWGIFQLNSNGKGMRALPCINKVCIMACDNSAKQVLKNRSMPNRCGGLYQNDRSFRGVVQANVRKRNMWWGGSQKYLTHILRG